MCAGPDATEDCGYAASLGPTVEERNDDEGIGRTARLQSVHFCIQYENCDSAQWFLLRYPHNTKELQHAIWTIQP